MISPRPIFFLHFCKCWYFLEFLRHYIDIVRLREVCVRERLLRGYGMYNCILCINGKKICLIYGILNDCVSKFTKSSCKVKLRTLVDGITCKQNCAASKFFPTIWPVIKNARKLLAACSIILVKDALDALGLALGRSLCLQLMLGSISNFSQINISKRLNLLGGILDLFFVLFYHSFLKLL